MIRETGPYGEGLTKVFQDAFTAGGGTANDAVAHRRYPDRRTAAMAAADAATEILFISSQQDWVIKFLNAASGQAGFMMKEIFLTDAAANAAVLTGAAASAAIFAQIRGTRPAPRAFERLRVRQLRRRLQAEYSGEDAAAATFSAHAYDGAWLVLYGAAWSLMREGSVTGSGDCARPEKSQRRRGDPESSRRLGSGF